RARRTTSAGSASALAWLMKTRAIRPPVCRLRPLVTDVDVHGQVPPGGLVPADRTVSNARDVNAIAGSAVRGGTARNTFCGVGCPYEQWVAGSTRWGVGAGCRRPRRRG